MKSSFDIHQLLGQAVAKAAQDLFGQAISPEQIQLQQIRKEFEGDITLVVFPLVKISKKSPEQTGEAIGAYLKENVAEVTAYNVVKGFLNISLSESFWAGFFQEALTQEHFGFAAEDSKPRVMVEFSSPNTNKPLHLGHLRNIFLGDSVSKMLKAAGHKTSRVHIINDRGIHICKSMLAWKMFGNGETPETSGLKGDKLVGKYYVAFDAEHKKQMKELMAGGMSEDDAKQNTQMIKDAQDLLRRWEAGDEEVMELWRMMNGWVYDGFNATYDSLNVTFDKLYYESETYLSGKDEVEKGLAQGIFFKKEDNSVWIDLTDEGLDQKVLQRKDGTAMYITQDIGTALLRFRDFPDTAYQIYTVGNEQEYHFKVLFKVLKKLGFEQADNCYHLSYGMVELPEGKMKSREGTVVDADDLIAEMANVAQEVAEEQGKLEGLPQDEKMGLYSTIGLAALKYFLLRVDPKKNMLFNPKESIDFNGNTGPSIQYTYVRTRAILRKAAEFGYTNFAFDTTVGLNKQEADLIKKIYEWPSVLQDAASSYNPASIAHYSYELARTYNSFYQENQILREENEQKRNLRLALTEKTGAVVRDTMGLLGINMPERM
jgi:arginyl-tRNA synthetase